MAGPWAFYPTSGFLSDIACKINEHICMIDILGFPLPTDAATSCAEVCFVAIVFCATFSPTPIGENYENCM